MARQSKMNTTIKNDPFGAHPYASVIPTDSPWGRDQERPEVARKENPPEEVAVLAARASPRTSGGLRPARGRSEPAVPASLPPADPRRHKLTVHLDSDLVNRVKNAAYWNPRLTIARIAERGIRRAVEEVERENGGPYQQRESELIGGRPIK